MVSLREMTELVFDERTLDTLQRYDFDLPTFRSLQNRVRTGGASRDHNRIQGADVQVPQEKDVVTFPTRGSDARKVLEARGRLFGCSLQFFVSIAVLMALPRSVVVEFPPRSGVSV